MKLVLALLAVQLVGAECPSALTLRGVGAATAARVSPYAACLNAMVGTEEKIRTSCGEARARAVDGRHGNRDKAKLDPAIDWLDAMIKERSMCETHLDVEA